MGVRSFAASRCLRSGTLLCKTLVVLSVVLHRQQAGVGAYWSVCAGMLAFSPAHALVDASGAGFTVFPVARYGRAVLPIWCILLTAPLKGCASKALARWWFPYALHQGSRPDMLLSLVFRSCMLAGLC